MFYWSHILSGKLFLKRFLFLLTVSKKIEKSHIGAKLTTIDDESLSWKFSLLKCSPIRFKIVGFKVVLQYNPYCTKSFWVK